MSHTSDSSQPAVYEIRIAGHLPARWSEWFAGFTVTLEPNGTTRLTGPVVDQAALYGLLRRVRDTGLTLIAVKQIPSKGGASMSTAKLMKAIVINAYGAPDVLELKKVAAPAIKEDEVLVRVHAASLNAGDLFALRGSPWLIRMSVGLRRPKDYILGWDMAGRVEAVGSRVTRFKPGDEVFGAGSGTLAEYAHIAEDKLAPKPANLTFEQAAAVPTAAVAALLGLRAAGKIQPGQKVLINGASGGVGTFAVQIAKAFGAEVTGVCSTRNVDLVRSIGADHVVDYTREDCTRNGQRYDLILDNVASRSFADLRRALTPQGKVIPNSGHAGMGYVFKALALSLVMRQHGSMYVAVPNSHHLALLTDLIEAGKVTPVIDRTYPLGDTRAAFWYLEKEHARGKVVITVAE